MARRRRSRLLVAVLSVLALGVAAVGGFATWIAVSYLRAPVDTVGEVEFTRPLAVPPLAESYVEDGVRVFSLEMQQGATDLGRGSPTPTWGFDGAHLGPTLRAARGERVRVEVRNSLDETSTVHWHGMHLPAEMDGGPHQPVAPGHMWTPEWEIDQPAATLWYHPHPHGETARHVYRGLTGMFLLDDPAEAEVQHALPHEYGVDDVPVMVQDVRFDGAELDEDGSLFSGIGLLGDTLLVNGTVDPYLDVTPERVRLRLLNASGARTYRFGFDDARRFDAVATDGGLLPAPVPVTELWLSPGERAEVVVTLAPGEETVLRSEATGRRGGGRFQGGSDRFDVLQLRAAAELAPSPVVPTTLAAAPDLSAEDVVRTRTFRLSGTAINGRDMDMDRIDETVTVDTTERWEVRNADGSPHNFHVHGTQFVVERIDGAPPPPELAGWKDTVFLPAGTEAELLVRFTGHTGARHPFMFHCHLLRHEDQGMMGQLVVVGPGQEAGAPPDHHDH